MVVWGDGMNYLICQTKKRWFGGGPGSLFAELSAHQGTPLVLFKGTAKRGIVSTPPLRCHFGNRTAWPFDWRSYQALCEEQLCASQQPFGENLRCLFAPSKAAVSTDTSPPPYLKLRKHWRFVLRAAKVLFKASSRFKQKHSTL